MSAGWWSIARRLVRIKDRRLGFLQFSFLAAIVGYIVGYALIWQQGYNTRVPASGVTQLAVRFALCGRRDSRIVSRGVVAVWGVAHSLSPALPRCTVHLFTRNDRCSDESPVQMGPARRSAGRRHATQPSPAFLLADTPASPTPPALPVSHRSAVCTSNMPYSF